MNDRTKPEHSEKPKEKPGILKKIIIKQKEGTLGETIRDWRWIFQYTRKYRWYVVVQTIFGVIGSTMGLLSSILSKYTVDIVTGKKTDYVVFIAVSMVVSAILGMLFSSISPGYPPRSACAFSMISAPRYTKGCSTANGSMCAALQRVI